MNELCCQINPWVRCEACGNRYCVNHWAPIGDPDHIFIGLLSPDTLKITCTLSKKEVHWANFDSWERARGQCMGTPAVLIPGEPKRATNEMANHKSNIY